MSFDCKIIMKQILAITLLVITVLSCSPRTYPVQSCNYMSEQNGKITLRSVGYGKLRVDALDAAEKNAIKTLLFRGVPGSQYSSPMIGLDEDQIINENPDYYCSLFEKGRHKSFISSSVPVTDYSFTKYLAWTVSVDVTINVVSLRKDLEQHGIIRKFGY